MTAPHQLPSHVGAFELLEPIGRGGMGEVWSARHAAQRSAVAVKLLARGLDRPRWREAFTREVRAVAALDHPGVVAVYDHGVVQLPDQALPWLAMELAPGGSLADRARGLRWNSLQRVLVELLEALAHAHARGVVHRDLKPGNVLFTAQGHAVLTDFGLAVALEDDSEGFVAGGTPSTMAPEQFRATAEDVGPWTDLYCLGAMTWLLVTGRRVFPGRSLQEQREGHLHSPVPRLEPRFPVPADLEGWLRRLLRKSPGDRPAWAADAHHALLQLGPPGEWGPPGPIAVDLEESSSSQDSTLLLSSDSPTRVLDGGEEQGVPLRSDSGGPSWKPPLPTLPAERPRRVQPVVGLGLYGLRSVAVVGREDERRLLWEALARVHETARPAAVILEGRGGVGKSRLARWIGRLAHEVGAASLLRATHGPTPGPDDGLSGLAARALRCLGAPPEQVPTRVDAVLRRWTPEAEAHRTRLLGLVDDSLAVREDGPQGQRAGHGLLTRLVGWAARDRCAVVWLDDVHHGVDALAFARFVVSQGTLPVLFVCTARSDLLASHPRATQALHALEELGDVTRLRLGDLTGADRARLVQALLPVSEEVAHSVGTRTGGNPLFAVQLLGAWVQEGSLHASADGFRPPTGTLAALPSSLEDVWRGRLAGLVTTDSARDALEVAASLGVEVSTSEWRAACAAAGVVPPEGLIASLQARGLITPDPDAPDVRWSFAHVLLREAVVDRARRAGRWATWNAACAKAFEGRTDGWGRVRLGHHLVEAGELEAALEPLARGAADLTDAMRLGEVYEALRARKEALEALGVPRTDERWWHHEFQEARIDLSQGRLTEADGRLEELWHASEGWGWSNETRAGIVRAWAWVGFQRGHAEQTIERAEQALSLSEGGTGVYHRAKRDLALSLAVLGRPADAEPLLWEVLPECERHGTRTGLVQLVLAQVLNLKGDLQGAWDMAAAAQEEFERFELWDGVASVENLLGEVARHRGELAEAEARYGRASELYRRIGSGYHVVSRVNLALIAVVRDEVVTARRSFVSVLQDCEAQGRDGIGNICRAGLVWAACREGRIVDAQRHLAGLRDGLDRTGLADGDVAQLLERTGREVAAGGTDSALAVVLLTLASHQQRALGAVGQADALSRLAEQVEAPPPSE